METLAESASAIARARRDILKRLSELAAENGPAPSPRRLIDELAGGRDRDPYRAAVTSLIASGQVEETPTWTLRLPTGNGASGL
jgi:hypothetical protein